MTSLAFLMFAIGFFPSGLTDRLESTAGKFKDAAAAPGPAAAAIAAGNEKISFEGATYEFRLAGH